MTNSGIPPAGVATTARPEAKASNMEVPRPSVLEVNRKISAWGSISGTSDLNPVKSI